MSYSDLSGCWTVANYPCSLFVCTLRSPMYSAALTHNPTLSMLFVPPPAMSFHLFPCLVIYFANLQVNSISFQRVKYAGSFKVACIISSERWCICIIILSRFYTCSLTSLNLNTEVLRQLLLWCIIQERGLTWETLCPLKRLDAAALI